MRLFLITLNWFTADNFNPCRRSKFYLQNQSNQSYAHKFNLFEECNAPHKCNLSIPTNII